MVTLVTRKAAWTALIIIDHLRKHGITNIARIASNGDVTFRKLGAYYVMYANDSGDLSVDLIPEIIRGHRPEPYTLPGCADSFANAGQTWNARNDQVTTYAPLRENPRRDVFGALKDTPGVEGYSDEDAIQVQKRLVARARAQARVREERGRELDTAARKLVQSRLRFRQGK